MIVGCCILVAVRCLLFVGCCVSFRCALFVVSCLVFWCFGVRCLLFAACWWFFDARCLLCVGCCVMVVVLCLSFAVGSSLVVACWLLLCIACGLLYVFAASCMACVFSLLYFPPPCCLLFVDC